MRRIRSHLTYANVMVTLLAIGALTGGVAYAANTVFSSDIVNDQVFSADVRNDSLTGGGLAAVDLRPDSVGPSEATGLVEGSGRLLSNRVVMVPGQPERTLLVMPGFGQLGAVCAGDHAEVLWRNTTTSTIDFWTKGNGDWLAALAPPGSAITVAHSRDVKGSLFSLGLGNDPGPRRIATMHAFAFQSSDGAPCGLQAQGTLWTSG